MALSSTRRRRVIPDTARGGRITGRGRGVGSPFGARPAGPAENATLTTAMAGTNNDIKFTSKGRGTAENSKRVRIVVAGNNTALSVSVSSNDITINSATNGSAAATSTAAQVIAAVNAHATAGHMVKAENAPGNDGTGVVAALAFTNLTGGTDYTIG